MTQDNGASLRDRAVVNGAGQAVSAVPASVPSAEKLAQARDAWLAAVQAGEDYPCKYWQIASCFYHYGGGCLGSCHHRDDYVAATQIGTGA